jgi:hypothetical protein
MKTNNVNTPGAQEQYLGIWSEQEKMQSSIDAIIDSALMLVESVPDGQKTDTINRWADRTFSNQKNLDIRQAIYDRAISRRQAFADRGCENVDVILQTVYNRAVTDVESTTALMGERGDFNGGPQSPATQGIGASERPSERTTAARPPVTLSRGPAAERLTAEVASHLYECDVNVNSEVRCIRKFFRGRQIDRQILGSVARNLEKNPKYRGLPQRKIDVFNKAVNRVTKRRRR